MVVDALYNKDEKNVIQSLEALGFFVVAAQISDFDTEELVSVLGTEERLRMEKFRRDEDVQRHIIAHGLKRLLLSQLIHVPVDELLFEVNEFGKPSCQNTGAPYFNISHSNDWVVIAISYDGDIGVDIDFPREVDHSGIFQRIASAAQKDNYEKSLVPKELFLHVWVQKEAVSKAHGRGMGVGMHLIENTGAIGTEKIQLLGQEYHLATFPWKGGGVLACSMMSEAPLISKPYLLQVKGINCQQNGLNCAIFQL